MNVDIIRIESSGGARRHKGATESLLRKDLSGRPRRKRRRPRPYERFLGKARLENRSLGAEIDKRSDIRVAW